MQRVLCVFTLMVAFAVTARAEPPFDRAGRLIERGHAAASVGDALSALGYYRDAISAAPRRDDGYIALGELYLQLGEPARALEVLLAGARWTVRGEALWLGVYAAYAALHDEDKALEALRQLRRVEPASRRGLTALAEQAERRGLFIEALAARRSLAALDGESAQRTQVRALEVLLGPADRARARSCTGSAVDRALARCR